MRILFIGNYQNGAVGEVADETHIVRELKHAGNTVYSCSRDEWREYVIEKFPIGKYTVPENESFDVAIICKWHHFYDGSFIRAIKEKYNCPVVYWTWDWMDYDGSWHELMAREADIFLTNEGGKLQHLLSKGIRAYYFSFDCGDGIFDRPKTELSKIYDVVFLGSCSRQGTRLEMIKEINKEIPITTFGYNHKDWQAEGFLSFPSVYGEEFVKTVNQSKIVLGINAFDDCWGYWSNRVGKTLSVGGFLLQSYVPGMELFTKDGVAYFSNAKEAIEKINYYLSHEEERKNIQERVYKQRI